MKILKGITTTVIWIGAIGLAYYVGGKFGEIASELTDMLWKEKPIESGEEKQEKN